MKTAINLITIFLCFIFTAYAEIIPDYFDIHGNPMHSADEFDLSITASVQNTAQGYLYSYILISQSTSLQKIAGFSLALTSDAVIPNSSLSPWRTSREPQPADTISVMGWATLFDPINTNLLVPGGQVSGFSFVSPYPPGVVQAYAEGTTEYPRFNDAYPDGHPLSSQRTPYGPGKIFPVIGPVKPAVAGSSKYSVLGCAGGLCDVQLDITGPKDPTGTVYSYQWSGPFGTALGAKPVVQLAPGAYQVSLSISDAQGVLLATATMPITVVDPNPPVNTTPSGGAGTGGNDMDHDGIADDEDDGRDGDGKSNDTDDDPDHSD